MCIRRLGSLPSPVSLVGPTAIVCNVVVLPIAELSIGPCVCAGVTGILGTLVRVAQLAQLGAEPSCIWGKVLRYRES